MVIGRDYLAQQAKTLLNLALTTRDRGKAAALLEKAADMKSKIDEANLTIHDRATLAPDIEPDF
jgi:hypothetical protein